MVEQLTLDIGNTATICPGCGGGYHTGECWVCRGTGNAVVVVHRYDVNRKHVGSRVVDGSMVMPRALRDTNGRISS